MYRIVCLMKQVPDTRDITEDVLREDGTVNRQALPAVVNPDDLFALEMALGVKDLYGGEITVLSMGPPAAVEVLREALSRGADKAALLTDKRFAGADTLATSHVLEKAVQRDEKEKRFVEDIRSGKTTLDLFGLSEKLERIGIKG